MLAKTREARLSEAKRQAERLETDRERTIRQLARITQRLDKLRRQIRRWEAAEPIEVPAAVHARAGAPTRAPVPYPPAPPSPTPDLEVPAFLARLDAGAKTEADKADPRIEATRRGEEADAAARAEILAKAAQRKAAAAERRKAKRVGQLAAIPLQGKEALRFIRGDDQGD